ncbi:MAG: hypothetical protein JW779_04250 [Candidatus Thorarchaeota archaeon]|nr:hypothetical protein [Candidatus Thorarchaeota archaeon]
MSSENPENKKPDEYWMGVRDALRMVDSFNKWAQRNPGRAKSLEDFIHDGLIAAAKRCESCLREKLGLSFVEDSDDVEEVTIPVESSTFMGEEEIIPEFESTPEIEFSHSSEDIPEPPDEVSVPLESSVSVSEAESPIDYEDELVSLDNVGRLEDDSMNDLDITGPPRDFTSDFRLVEPKPLVVDEEEPETQTLHQIETPDDILLDESDDLDESEEFLDEVTRDNLEEETTSEVEPEESHEKTSFTWSDYEAAVTPVVEPEPADVEEEEPSLEEEAFHESPETTEDSESTEPPKVWTPYDEPSLPEEDVFEDEDDLQDAEVAENDESDSSSEPIIEPPAPPPPPESEEDEEERRRRARRLFFGA